MAENVQAPVLLTIQKGHFSILVDLEGMRIDYKYDGKVISYWEYCQIDGPELSELVPGLSIDESQFKKLLYSPNKVLDNSLEQALDILTAR
ncbi:MAG: hypothetical protein ACRCXZ_03550 [Patescibacteria group bacterium]